MLEESELLKEKNGRIKVVKQKLFRKLSKEKARANKSLKTASMLCGWVTVPFLITKAVTFRYRVLKRVNDWAESLHQKSN